MLRPDQVFVLPSGLWVLDALQPVAAVVDPDVGGLIKVVSWQELPAAPGTGHWPMVQVRSDGSCLWTQQDSSGPLVRVGLEGVSTAAWTGGLMLAACGPDVAWCASAPPDQELVIGPDPHPVRQLVGSRLLRVTADGVCTSVRTDASVRAVQADAQGLLVRVDEEGWTLRHLGGDTYEVLRASRWLRLPCDAPLPEVLTVVEHGLAADFVPDGRVDGGGSGPFLWHEDGPVPVDGGSEAEAHHLLGSVVPAPDPCLPPRLLVALGLLWRFGRESGRFDLGGRRAIASAYTLQGEQVRRWDLGSGTVPTVTPIGDRMCVAMGPSSARSVTSGRVVLLDPSVETVAVVLLGEEGVDITEQCWPLPPRPLDADSYLAQTLADNSRLDTYWQAAPDAGGDAQLRPLAAGLSGARTALVGDWPHTHLEWSFGFAPYPGLALRRRVPLFDELGRLDPPEYADINLMEDLDTRNLPPASEARDGVLDV